MRRPPFLLVAALAAIALTSFAQAIGEACRIEIVERGTGWPVPLVELRTTHGVRFFSDNAGTVAFDLPEMMGREVWLDVSGDGYEVPADGFGFRGVRLTPKPGKTLKVEVDRTSVARRLGRLTGAGLFAESQKTGRDLDAKESGVTGCDSVQLAAHGGRLFWLWGDTTLADNPLGIFHSTAATTALDPLKEFVPPLRVDFDYFTDGEGRPRAVAKMPGDGPTWITGLVSLPDKAGTPRLVATYMKVKALDDIYEWGLCAWDETKKAFVRERVLWTKSPDSTEPPPMPTGHAMFWKDADGKKWLLFGHPLPSLKCPPTFEAWASPETWERLDPPHELQAADGSGAVKPHDGVHSGSIAWSPFRKRWITVFQETGGKPSPLGEIWYAEADSPLGPWGPAVKVLSHRNHTFYNVRLHPELVPDGAPFVLFEGTYTAQFAPAATPTPRHDYNQILYRLDLDDPALLPTRAEATCKR